MSKKPTRIALGVEYDGGAYHGWQSQRSPRLPTIQDALQDALASIAGHPVSLICAGRTDAGVHASAQVAHFDTTAERPLKAWIKGGNARLPPSIGILWARQPGATFHARFSATSRRYRYILYNRPTRSPLLRGRVKIHFPALREGSMARAGRYLLGEWDFTSYRGTDCQSPTPMRRVTRLDVTRHGDFVVVDIEANAFLLRMVRNIAGVLLEIGEGKHPPRWAREVLEKKDRTCAGITAPPWGLYLVQVTYPEHFSLPVTRPGPAFLLR